MDTEVLIVGGGPAGLASAIAVTQAGFSVEVAEPCPGAIDKCCGEGLLPPAVSALQQLGIPLASLQRSGSPLRGIRFHHGGYHADASFPSQASGIGMRRTELYTLLRSRAQELGIRITAASARLLPCRDAFRIVVGNKERAPRWVIGADGAQSHIRGAAGLNKGHIASQRFALRQHFQLASSFLSTLPLVEIFWARGAQAYVTPVGGGRVSVAVVAKQKLTHMEEALARFPALAHSLREAKPCSRARGAVSTHRTLQHVQRQGQRCSIALVGDASGSVDAITGDGLSLAFAQALAFGSALREGNLHTYEQAHAQLMRGARAMSHSLLAMGAHPMLTRASMLLLAHVPNLFSTLLRLHTKIPSARILSPPWVPDILRALTERLPAKVAS